MIRHTRPSSPWGRLRSGQRGYHGLDGADRQGVEERRPPGLPRDSLEVPAIERSGGRVARFRSRPRRRVAFGGRSTGDVDPGAMPRTRGALGDGVVGGYYITANTVLCIYWRKSRFLQNETAPRRGDVGTAMIFNDLVDSCIFKAKNISPDKRRRRGQSGVNWPAIRRVAGAEDPARASRPAKASGRRPRCGRRRRLGP